MTEQITGRCSDCRLRPSAPPTPADALTGGRWMRHPLRHVLVWIPDGQPAPTVERERARARQLRMALAERYGTYEWWTKHGEPFDDSAAVLEERRRLLVEESYEQDRCCTGEAGAA